MNKFSMLLFAVFVSCYLPVLAQSGTELSLLQTGTESTTTQTQTEQPLQTYPEQQPEVQPQYQPYQPNQPYQPQLAQPNPSALQIGATWNEAALGQMECRWKWFVIPSWLAGKWHREKTKAQLFGFLPLTIKADRNRVYGYQTDERGRIWHLVRTPYKAKVERDGYFDMFVVRDEQLISNNDNSITMKTTWTRYVVKNGKIKEVINGSQVDTIRNTSDGITTAYSKMKIGTATWTDKRVQQYSPIDEYGGVYLPDALLDFRRARGTSKR